VDIELRGAGAPTLRLSDKNIDYDVYSYARYIDNISGLAEDVERAGSGGMNADVSILFLNDPWGSDDRLIELESSYPFDGAVCTIKAVHLMDDGTPSEAETVFVGRLDQPEAIDLVHFRCRVSSKEFFADLAY
jgi:hypothetical protein